MCMNVCVIFRFFYFFSKWRKHFRTPSVLKPEPYLWRCSYGSFAANAAQHIAKFCLLALLIVRCPLCRTTVQEKRLACKRYEEMREELGGVKDRSEREIQNLKEHLRLAMAALQEGQNLGNSLDHWESAAALTDWRGAGSSTQQPTALRSSTPESGQH